MLTINLKEICKKSICELKIEEGQFVSKITEMPGSELVEYYQELYDILNIKALEN